MDAIEVRAAAFAVRTNYSHHRAMKRRVRKWAQESRERLGLGDHETKMLRRRSGRVIHSMERHLKRANRRLLAAVPRDAYDALMDVWQMHLRWMRYHLAYFKPPLPTTFARKTRHQRVLDTLSVMAEKGLQNAGYQPPDSAELRRVMRLFTASARRFREGDWLQTALRDPKDFTAKWYLARFVLRRIELKELREG